MYIQRGSSTAPPFVHSKKQNGKAQKTHPTPHIMCHRHRPPHLMKTSHHTCKYKAVSYPSNPPPFTTRNNPLFLRSIWFADTLLEREQTHRVTLPDNWDSSLPHHRTLGTRHPLPPHGTLVLHQIIYDYLILYTYEYIHCQDARDLDIIVFCFFLFWGFFVCFCILYSTSLSSYVQPDDGHHYGRNM